MTVSIAQGQGRPIKEQKDELKQFLGAQGFIAISFAHSGPDIIARASDHVWKIECKGLSARLRKPGAARAHLYEALGQAVSYYDEPDHEGKPELHRILDEIANRDMPMRLGLALPHSRQHHGLLRRVVTPSLRRRLGLWIFIVDPETKSVECYDPDRKV